MITGSIPTEVGLMTALKTQMCVHLCAHAITLSRCSTCALRFIRHSWLLTSFDLPPPPKRYARVMSTRRNLQTNELSGSIPSEVGLLTGLFKMYVHLMLQDSVSFDFQKPLSRRTACTLRLTCYTWALTSRLGDLLPRARSVSARRFLNNNQLSGTIPPEVGQMTALNTLYVHTRDLPHDSSALHARSDRDLPRFSPARSDAMRNPLHDAGI